MINFINQKIFLLFEKKLEISNSNFLFASQSTFKLINMKNLYTRVFYLRLFSKNFFTFLIFHFGYSSGNYLLAQATDWKFQNPSPTANNIIDVHFISEQNGWAVGDAGTILFTSNSGQDWGVQSSNTANSLSSVQFSNEQTGWIVGANGYILKTNNAGFTWLPQLSNTVNGLNDRLCSIGSMLHKSLEICGISKEWIL